MIVFPSSLKANQIFKAKQKQQLNRLSEILDIYLE